MPPWAANGRHQDSTISHPCRGSYAACRSAAKLIPWGEGAGLHLYLFHYHLLPGGVTTVIRDGAPRPARPRGPDSGAGPGWSWSPPAPKTAGLARRSNAGASTPWATMTRPPPPPASANSPICSGAGSATECGGSTTITWPRNTRFYRSGAARRRRRATDDLQIPRFPGERAAGESGPLDAGGTRFSPTPAAPTSATRC